MIELLYSKLAIPETCHLGNRVYKRLFRENAELSVTDRKAFADDIDTITWQYTLKPSTIPIQVYEDDDREYSEIAVLQVNLKTLRRTARIAEIIHRAIPYPLVLIFAFEGSCALSLAHKRFSHAEKGATVVEEFRTTEWIDLVHPTPTQQEFLDSLTISSLPFTHFFAFYSGLVERLISLDCAHLTGAYVIGTTIGQRESRRKRLAICHALELEITEQRVSVKKETRFNRQVELNIKIKELESQLQRETADL